MKSFSAVVTSDINNIEVNTVGGIVFEAIINIRLASSYHKELMSYLKAIENFKLNSFVFSPKYLNYIVFNYCITVLYLRDIGTPPTKEYLLKMRGFEQLEKEITPWIKYLNKIKNIKSQLKKFDKKESFVSHLIVIIFLNLIQKD